MTPVRPLAVAVLVLTLAAGSAACGTVDDDGSGTAVSTQSAAEGSLRLVEVATGLEAPTHVAVAPGDESRLYVVEQAGRIRLVEDGRVREEPFLDLTAAVGSDQSEQGLLSVAFHPQYEDNGLLYVDYTNRDGDTEVVELESDGERADPASARLVFAADQPYANHNGGQLAFGPDGKLYVGMGDGGDAGDPENRAQDPANPLGKIWRLDVDTQEATPELVAYGLRNPWRFSFDRDTGDLWIGDVGQNEWEEVDRIPAGTDEVVNFGWDVFEGTHPFEDKEPTPVGVLLAPVLEYSHEEGCSVTGGFVYRGSAVPALAGRYVFGDYCSGRIWSALAAPDGTVEVREEPVTVDALSSFGEDARGELLVASGDGAIYRLEG